MYVCKHAFVKNRRSFLWPGTEMTGERVQCARVKFGAAYSPIPAWSGSTPRSGGQFCLNELDGSRRFCHWFKMIVFYFQTKPASEIFTNATAEDVPRYPGLTVQGVPNLIAP